MLTGIFGALVKDIKRKLYTLLVSKYMSKPTTSHMQCTILTVNIFNYLK